MLGEREGERGGEQRKKQQES